MIVSNMGRRMGAIWGRKRVWGFAQGKDGGESPTAIYSRRIQQIRKIKDDNMRNQHYEAAIQQLNQTLTKQEQHNKIQKVRNYLLEGIQNKEKLEQQARRRYSQEDEQPGGYIPPGLVLKKLKFMDRRILMMGIEEENEDHCIYFKRMSQKMGVKTILTALPPDMPYFIKTQQSFTTAFQSFLQSPSSPCHKFYLSPTPHKIQQCSLSSTQIPLVRKNLSLSKQFHQIFYAILQHNKKLNRFVPNGLLTPLLVVGVERVIFCDWPVLKEREMWAMLVKVEDMRDLFRIYHRECYADKELMFDPRILFPKPIINRKFQHISNILKHTSTPTPTILLCPSQYCQQLCQQFKKDTTVAPTSNFSYSVSNEPVLFIDFIEKLVIMDIILEPVIEKYFVKNQSFPYTACNTVGGAESIGKVFMVWRHFYSLYLDRIGKKPGF